MPSSEIKQVQLLSTSSDLEEASIEESPAAVSAPPKFPEVLAHCELLLSNSRKLAVGISYRPGETPKVVVASQASEARTALALAQQQGIPVFEWEELNAKAVRALEVGQEIPEFLYRAVAHGLALCRKSPTSLQRVVYQAPPRPSQDHDWGQLDTLELNRIDFVVGTGIDGELLSTLLEVHRQQLQLDTGIPLSSFQLQVDETLQPLEYRLRLQGVIEASGSLEKPQALDPLLQSLYAIVSRDGWKLIGFRETESLVKLASSRSRALVKELMGQRVSLAQLRVVLRQLLREALPVRDIVSILERISEVPPQVQDPEEIAEYVRGSFSRYLCRKYSDEFGVMHGLLLEPLVEQRLFDQLRNGPSPLWLDLDIDASLNLLRSVHKGVEKARDQNVAPVVICSPRPRRYLRQLLESSYPFVPVLSFAEIAPYTDLRIIGNLNL